MDGWIDLPEYGGWLPNHEDNADEWEAQNWLSAARGRRASDYRGAIQQYCDGYLSSAGLEAVVFLLNLMSMALIITPGEYDAHPR